MAVILAALRIAIRVFDTSVTGGVNASILSCRDVGVSSNAIEAIIDGTFWRKVQDSSVEVDLEFVSALDSALDRRNIDGFPALFGRVRNISLFADLTPEARELLLNGTVRAVAAVSQLMISRSGEGLSRFARRFEVVSDARKFARGAGSQAISSSIILKTIDRLAPISTVVGLEFRKTVAETNASAFEREIWDSLGCHVEAFKQASRFKNLALSMPVGFLRRQGRHLNPWLSARAEIETVVHGVSALRNVASRLGDQMLTDVVWSVDVANDELGSNNWPYQVGFELLNRSQLDLIFTIHAGESFSSRLNGLRRVGELFLGRQPPHRIGHALALSDRSASKILKRGTPRISVADAIADLCWYVNCDLSLRDSAFNLLCQILAPRCPRQFAVGGEVFVDAFVNMHKVDGLVGRVLHDIDDEATRGVLGDVAVEDICAAKDPLDIAILAMSGLIPGESIGIPPASALSGNLRDDYDILSDLLYEETRRFVLDMVIRADCIVESCPTSNSVLSGGVEYTNHPMFDWLDIAPELKITISSDDPTLFSCTILDEFGAMRTAGIGENALERIARLSVDTCSGGPSRRGWTSDDYDRVLDLTPIQSRPYVDG